MEDIIDIIVTETTNLITITSSGSDEVIDVNIIDNREDIVLNVTPTVVEININSLVGNFGVNWGEITGTLSNQTDLQNVLNVKADLVGGLVPAGQLPSFVDDVVEVATFAALPVTGEQGKIYVVLATNLIYRWSGSTYIEIKDSSAVWGAITGTLSSQTDLQNALNAKEPTITAGTTLQYYRGDKTFQTLNTTVVVEGANLYYLDSRARAAISGGTGISYNSATGVITNAVTSGLIATALGYTPADDALVVKLAGAQTITGTKTFNQAPLLDLGAGFKNSNGVYNYLQSLVTGWQVPVNGQNHNLIFSTATNYVYTFPNASGTIALTSDLHNAVTIGTANGLSLSTQILSLGLASSIANGALSSTDWATFNAKQAALSGTGFVKISGTTISYDNSTYISGSGITEYYARFTSSGVIADGFISTSANITNVQGMGLTTLNGLNINGNYGAGGGGQKIRSFDETTGNAYIDFANTGGRFYLGVNRSTSGGLMTNATAYATVLTTALGTTNLELGTNATKRFTLDGTSGAATFTSSVTASALYVNGMTAGSGAIYHTASRLTLANYNANGILHFEVNGGNGALTLNANLSATFASTLSATGATLTGALSGTSATFKGIGIFNNSATGDANSGIRIVAPIATTHYNWMIAAQQNVGATFEITPSTAVGGTTFSTPALQILSTGAATFSSSVTTTGNNIFNNSGGRAIDAVSTGVLFAQNGGAHNIIFGDGNVRYFSLFTPLGAASMSIRNFSTSTDLLTIASTGAATFSSSVTAGAHVNVNNGAINFGGSGSAASTDPAIYRIGGLNDLEISIGSTPRLRITSGGLLAIGTTAALINESALAATSNGNTVTFKSTLDGGSPLLIWSSPTVNNNGFVQFGTEGSFTVRGSITYNRGAGLTVFNTTSDYRIKTDISEFDALNIITKLKPKEYKIIDATNKSIGFIAHELQEYFPQAVCGEKDGEILQQVDYSQLTGLLTKGVQEVDTKVVNLEKEIVSLKAELDILKNK